MPDGYRKYEKTYMQFIILTTSSKSNPKATV